MANRDTLGGVIHTYQRYDPKQFPSPTQPPPDLVSSAFEHLMMFGEKRELTEEELARAVRLDPSQIQGFGPSIDAILALLRQRRRKILATYETRTVRQRAHSDFIEHSQSVRPPKKHREQFCQAVREEQLRDIERLWYAAGDDQSSFARALVGLIETLGNKYQIDELAAQYPFTGRDSLTVPQAIEIKEELLRIDELIKQLEEAAKTAQIGLIDMEALAEFAEPGDIDQLSAIQQQVQDYLREMAEKQGLEQHQGHFKITPKAYRVFQSKLINKIFSGLQSSRSGRHPGTVSGEGAVETQKTRAYEFGDSVAHIDIPETFANALIRQAGEAAKEGRHEKNTSSPIKLDPQDIRIHTTRNNPKCATCVLMDMSGSMRYDGQYINVKRMALTLEGLIRSEYPGDYLQYIELFSFAKKVERGRIIELMPKPVTLHDPVVRLCADMSRTDISEVQVPPHFTNIQHGLATARRMLATQNTPNRQILLITDGLPTAHFEGEMLYLLYPPDPQTELATMREGQLCEREGITINLFLLPSWSQSEADIRFAYQLAESTRGRVFFTAGHDLDRYVVWDYLERRRDIFS